MALAATALVTLAEARNALLDRSHNTRIEALRIYHPGGGGVTAANVSVLTTTLVLYTNLATVTLDLTLAANDTLQELVNVINGTGTWEAELLGPAGANSLDLTPIFQADTYLYTKMKTLMAEGNLFLERIIDGVSLAIESFCDAPIKSATYTEYFNGVSPLVLHNRPVTVVTRIAQGHLQIITVHCSLSTATRASVQVNATQVILAYTVAGVITSNTLTIATYATLTLLAAAITALGNWVVTINSGYAAYPTADLVETAVKPALAINRAYLSIWEEDASVKSQDLNEGIVYLESPPRGRNVIRVNYTGGYVTVPDDLKILVYEMIAQVWDNSKRDNSLRMEKFADHSWTAKETLFDRNVRMRLAKYMNIRF